MWSSQKVKEIKTKYYVYVLQIFLSINFVYCRSSFSTHICDAFTRWQWATTALPFSTLSEKEEKSVDLARHLAQLSWDGGVAWSSLWWKLRKAYRIAWSAMFCSGASFSHVQLLMYSTNLSLLSLSNTFYKVGHSLNILYFHLHNTISERQRIKEGYLFVKQEIGD